jgi:single-strand DNA-binding protein
MTDFNRVILAGRVGNNLELKHSAQNKPYIKLSLATHSFKQDGKKSTHWHRVVVFGDQAEVCSRYLSKGSEVLVEGSLEVKTFTEKGSGTKRTFVSILANKVLFMGSRLSAEVIQENEAIKAEFHDLGISEEQQAPLLAS